MPADLYEAVKVDGAGAIHRFWRITVPLIMPLLFTIVIPIILLVFFTPRTFVSGSTRGAVK